MEENQHRQTHTHTKQFKIKKKPKKQKPTTFLHNKVMETTFWWQMITPEVGTKGAEKMAQRRKYLLHNHVDLI